MKRCIICKKEIIEFGEKYFVGFQSIFPPKEFDKACYFVCNIKRYGNTSRFYVDGLPSRLSVIIRGQDDEKTHR